MSIALTGLVAAWWHYPAENHFSILNCTISFLGSPDTDRNPHGWRFYQVGMTALVLLLYSLVAERHARLHPQIGKLAQASSAGIAVSLMLILLATWIPDSRQHWFGIRLGHVHTRMAIFAIPFMMSGLMLDTVALWWSGVRFRALWPLHLYGCITLFGILKVTEWKRMCRRDPTLTEWPGEGLHSTPLWEWIAFAGLIAVMVWMSRGAWTDKKQSRIESQHLLISR